MAAKSDSFLIPPEWIPDHAKVLAGALRDEAVEAGADGDGWREASYRIAELLLEQINERVRDHPAEVKRVGECSEAEHSTVSAMARGGADGEGN